MAEFFARVELHNATSSDYDTLHEKMDKAGFYRFVLDPNTANKHMYLPTGSYVSYTAGPIDRVALKVREIANSVKYLNKVYCAKVAEDRRLFDNF
jgi:hypothetical protein